MRYWYWFGRNKDFLFFMLLFYFVFSWIFPSTNAISDIYTIWYFISLGGYHFYARKRMRLWLIVNQLKDQYPDGYLQPLRSLRTMFTMRELIYNVYREDDVVVNRVTGDISTTLEFEDKARPELIFWYNRKEEWDESAVSPV